MVYNIYGFIRFSKYIGALKSWKKGSFLLRIPILLLGLFLLGYLMIGFWGNPDLIVAGILFGGSIFVFIIYHLLYHITRQVIESEQMEAELLAVEKSNQEKSSFLASVSHEMRTPMNVILGLDKIALNNPRLEPDTRECLEKIGQSGRHLLELINNILDINQIETGGFIMKAETFSLPEMLKQIDSIAATLCLEKGLAYRTSSDESAADYYIGDELQIKHVLLELLDNAVKYTDPPGTVTFACQVVSNEKDITTLQFTISDTGVGMSPEFLKRVFEDFSQEDATSTNRYGGSGLGLAAAQRKVRLMGGSISATSRKNEGSSFMVTIPLLLAHLVKELSEKPGALDSLKNCRILVVEDIQENAEIVMDLLELEEAVTEHAPNGLVALEMFRQSSEGYYDAVLMDLRMPIMDGLEAVRRIRGLERHDAGTVPIIALTANAFESDVKQSLEAGMDEHLVKPVDSDKLYETLKHLIWQERNCPKGEAYD